MIGLDQKMDVISLYKEHKSFRKVCEITGLSRNTVKRIIKSRIENSKPDRIIIATDNIYDRIKNLKPNKIFLALDNDHAGHSAMKILAQKLSPITTTTHVVYHAKDPNDLLLKINQPKSS